MSVAVYQIIHVVGICALFMGLAYGLNAWNKKAAIAHGVGLLLILISGFAMHAKSYSSQWFTWIFIKIAIWLVFGGILVLIKRKKLTGGLAWVVLLSLAAVAAWVVYYGKTLPCLQ